MTKEVSAERRGQALWITVDRSEARNAMTFAMYDRLAELCREANADRTVRAVAMRLRPEIAWPFRAMPPCVGGIRPMMASARVDLPQPDSPTTPKVSPLATERERSSTARTTLRPRPSIPPPTGKCWNTENAVVISMFFGPVLGTPWG